MAVAETVRNLTLADPCAAGCSEGRLLSSTEGSLEAAIVETWQELVSCGRAECPVCGGCMRDASGCDDCGSELS